MSKDKFQNKRLFERMAVRLANHLGLADTQYFECLSPALKCYFDNLKYIDIVAPLMRDDYKHGNLSIQQIALKYHVSKSVAQFHLAKPVLMCCTESSN